MLTIGKIHRLQKCASPDGKFIMLALDHRNNLQRAFNPTAPDTVPYTQIADFKRDIVAALSGTVTGVLLDPQYGAAPSIASGALSPTTGLLVAVEKTGYSGSPAARESQILPDWSVEKIARLGAVGVKLLIYYHPDAPNAPQQESLVKQVSEACHHYDIPLFLEPLSFSLDPTVKKLASPEKRQVVIETARRLTSMGVEVLKAEFPLNISDEPDELVWAEACAELTETSLVPWVLLSAGVSFEQFARQTAVACQNGACGVLAGRAVWKEAVTLNGTARQTFLQTTATQRIAQLTEIIKRDGRDWASYYPDLPQSAPEGWYRSY